MQIQVTLVDSIVLLPIKEKKNLNSSFIIIIIQYSSEH